MMIRRERKNRYSLPIEAKAAKENIVGAAIRFGVENAADVGARCFLQRTAAVGGAKISVEPSSFIPERAPFFCRVVDGFCRLSKEELSDPTLSGHLRQLLAWMDWADVGLNYDCVASEENTRKALLEFDFHLIGRVRTGKLTGDSSIKKMDALQRVLSEVYQVDNICAEIPQRFYNHSRIKSEIPPSSDEMEIALSLYMAIFHGLFDAVLDEKEFPFPIEVPARFKRVDNLAYIFPTLKCFSLDEEGYLPGSTGNLVWNFSNGNIEDPKVTGRIKFDTNIKETKRRLYKTLQCANEPGKNRYRLFLAGLAYRAAIQLFLANTGMNLSVLCQQKWKDDYEEVSLTQGFRGYKPRAGYAEVEFIISAQFIPTFRKIIELRKYLLQGNYSELLFFSGNLAVLGEIGIMPASELQRSIAFFESIDPAYQRMGSKKIRVFKVNDILSKHGVETAANAAQNSETTVLRNYSEGNQATTEKELSGFFRSIPIRIALREENHEPSGVGGCPSRGNPKQLVPVPNIESNCEEDEGCLFCVHHLVHQDEQDMWKLLSCKFVVVECGSLFVTDSDFEKILGPVKHRIDEVITLMIGNDETRKSQLEAVTIRVFDDGDLHPYWAAKMEIYQLLG